ncbi:MAG: transposase, partial [Solirubrobacteraceae bacterium]
MSIERATVGRAHPGGAHGTRDRGAGRLAVVADDPSLTPHAGLAVVGDLARHLGLVGLIDGELAVERRARPVKTRRRGVSAGGLVVSLAECQLVGGAFFGHLEDLRADTAGAALRAVGDVPSAPAALQVSKRFRRVHCQRVERAMSRAGQRLDRGLGREADESVTIDLDATQITVYGRGKDGAARCRTGEMSYAPHIAFWAQRGRALTGELVGGNQERLSGADCATIATRAIAMLPPEHGPVDMRVDSAYYAVDLLHRCARSTRASRSRSRAAARCGRHSPRSPTAPGRTRLGWRARRSPRRPTGRAAGSTSRCG